MMRNLEPFGVNGLVSDGKLQLTLSENLVRYSVVDCRTTEVAVIYGRVLKYWAGPGIAVTDTNIRLGFPISSLEDIERLIGGLHGSFLLETLSPLPHRLYADVGGTIPLVYCPEIKQLSSSAGMMFDEAEYRIRFLSDRHKRLIESDIAGAWIPGFLTAHKGVFRLLPNFYLDLSNWTAHRYWPTQNDLTGEISLEDAALSAANSIRSYINAVAAEFKEVALSLTAGFDTRILLAGSREIGSRAKYFTVSPVKLGLDQIAASEIAKAFSLDHRLIPVIHASPVEIRRWDTLVGHTTREVSREFHPTLGEVRAEVMLTGMYGEIGRSRLYEKELDAIDQYRADARFVAGRIGSPMYDREVLETLEDWLSTISWAPTSKLLDVAFNELRFGGWAMSQAPIQRAIQFSLMPFAQQQVQLAFINCRPSIKTTSALFSRIGYELWPEAMQFPVNRYGDFRDTLALARKFVTKEHLVRTWRYVMARVRARQ